jgi:hypothetical protein
MIKKFFFGDTAKLIIWQAIIWDRFAKIVPVILVITVLINYLLGERDWNLMIDGIITFFLVFGVVWWLWIIYTIATIATILDRSQYGLKEVIAEIRQMHKEINNIKKEG